MNAQTKPVLAKTVEDALNELPADTLHSAMARAFAEIEAATKDAVNPAFKQGGKVSKYANLGAVIDAVKPALVNHGLWVTQHCQPSDHGVTVETILHHRGGESMSMGSLYVPANNQNPQGFGSALTYARRYAFQTAFVVPTEDDDGNAGTEAVRERPQANARPAPQAPKSDPVPDGIDEAAVWTIQGLAKTASVSIQTICERANVSELCELTPEKADGIVKKLKLTIEARKQPADVLAADIPY